MGPHRRVIIMVIAKINGKLKAPAEKLLLECQNGF
jgi:hypothetical protein